MRLCASSIHPVSSLEGRAYFERGARPQPQVRILTRHSAFGELYQMVLEALHTSRAFLAFLLLICVGGSLPLGLLLFDVHTVIPEDGGYPHGRSSGMLLLQARAAQGLPHHPLERF